MAVKVWNVPSLTHPEKQYTISLFMDTKGLMKAGSFSCTCFAWKYQHKEVSERECKHIRKLREELEDRGGIVESWSGSAVIFEDEVVKNGRLHALLESINF
jgi:hypothetical protein